MAKKLLVVVVLLGIGLLVVDYAWTLVWDGRFDVRITVLDNGRILDTSEVRRVSIDWSLMPQRWPESDEKELGGALEDAQFDGRNFIAHVPCSGTESGLRLRDSRSQPRKLYIEIELIDGRMLRCVCPLTQTKHHPAIIVDIRAMKTQPASAPAAE